MSDTRGKQVRIENQFNGTQIKEILELYKDKSIPLQDIAKQYNIGTGAILRLGHKHGIWRKNGYKRRARKLAAIQNGATPSPRRRRVVASSALPSSHFTMLILDSSNHIKVAVEGDSWKLYDEIMKLVRA